MNRQEMFSNIHHLFCVFTTVLLWIGKGTCTSRNNCSTIKPRWQHEDCSHRVAVHSDRVINISSPSFPCALPRTVNCMWELDVSKGKRMSLEFLTFDIPGHASSGGCLEAYVEYGQYNALNRRVVVGERLCGALTRFRVNSTSSTYWLTLERFWSSNETSHQGLLIQVKQISKDTGQSDGDATVVAICAFIVPLFCAFPVYHCLKRMSEVNKRKKFLSKMARLRERERETRQRREIDSSDKKMSVSDDKVSVPNTIAEDLEGQVLAEFNLYQYLSGFNPNGSNHDNNNNNNSTSNHI